ncbi:MAG: hypothetical protein QW244_01510 [Candidatus Pacearchaeota archaeon]
MKSKFLFAFALCLFLDLSLISALDTSSIITTKAVAYGWLSFFIVPKCSSDLVPGWNFVSVCTNKTGSINEIFNYEQTNFRYILKWNGTEFQVYSPRALDNPFNLTNLNESYFILVDNVTSIGFGGANNSDLEISMNAGWNAPSWPYEFNASIIKYFNASLHKYLMKWNKQSQEFEIYSPLAQSNPFDEIFVGEGQFILATQPHLLIYNRSKLILNKK